MSSSEPPDFKGQRIFVSKDIFIAFTGPKIEQLTSIHEMSTGYECWNLAAFKMDEFLRSVQERIPPINENVLKNYARKAAGTGSPFGIDGTGLRTLFLGLVTPRYRS